MHGEVALVWTKLSDTEAILLRNQQYKMLQLIDRGETLLRFQEKSNMNI